MHYASIEFTLLIIPFIYYKFINYYLEFNNLTCLRPWVYAEISSFYCASVNFLSILLVVLFENGLVSWICMIVMSSLWKLCYILWRIFCLDFVAMNFTFFRYQCRFHFGFYSCGIPFSLSFILVSFSFRYIHLRNIHMNFSL